MLFLFLLVKEMNSSNITSALMKQASCIQTFSSVCVKRQCILPSVDAALYGKRFASNIENENSSSGSSNANRRVNSSPGSEAKRLKSEPQSSDLPEEPTDCCMSGCANCVWIQYAEELKKKFCSSDEDLREIIMNKISDPNMKMFLSIELDNLCDADKWRPSSNDNITK